MVEEAASGAMPLTIVDILELGLMGDLVTLRIGGW